MKVLISHSDADTDLIHDLGVLLASVDVELEHDLTLMNGTAVAGDLKERLAHLAGWIIALGHPSQVTGWIDREVVELLRLGDVIVVPLYLGGFEDNPVYSALADRPGVSVLVGELGAAARAIARTFRSSEGQERIRSVDQRDSRHEVTAPYPRYRVVEDFAWGESSELGWVERYELIDQLAADFPVPSDALPLLRRINFPLARVPAFVDAAAFWNSVARDLEQGASAARPPFLRLLEGAVRIYRTNPILRDLAIRHGLLVPDDGRSGRGIRVLVREETGDGPDGAAEKAEGALQRLGLDPVMIWATSKAALYEVNASDVEEASTRIAQEPSLSTTRILSATDPDYLIRQVHVQGPDGRLFRMMDVPAADTLGEIAQDFVDYAYPTASTSRQTVLLRTTPDQPPAPLNFSETLDDIGVRDYDRFTVGYQTTAGCFPAEARVHLADGSTKPIADLLPGDLLITSSRFRDRMIPAPVLGVATYEQARCMTINRQLTITLAHPVLVNSEWRPAGEIRLGDQLVGADGSIVVVTALETGGGLRPVHFPVLQPSRGGFFVDGIFVQNVIDDDIYEEFRTMGFDPRSARSAMERLATLKQSFLSPNINRPLHSTNRPEM